MANTETIGNPPLKMDDVASLLASAFEGGSNYWYTIEKFVEPEKLEYRTDPEKVFRHIDYPLNYGGILVIGTLEGDEHYGKKKWTLSRLTITDGIKVMYDKYPSHFADVLKENSDATTGDVFLQCCLFGELIYG